jgi:acetyltransferase-like isoleucine patch superfamily enzyme
MTKLQRMGTYKIGKNVEIGENVAIDKTSSIGSNVRIEDGVRLGKNVVIKDDVIVKKNVTVEDNATIGYNNLTKKKEIYEEYPTIIGENALIRTNTVIYKSCKIGKNSWVNHNTILRENTEVGDNSTIGNLVMCEGYTKIGNQVAIHSLSGLGGNMIIEDKVFIATNMVTANGRRPTYLRTMPYIKDKGPTIRYGARIGISVILLPEIEIGREALVASGALVTKDVPPFSIVMGVPAKVIGSVPDEERLQ